MGPRQFLEGPLVEVSQARGAVAALTGPWGVAIRGEAGAAMHPLPCLLASPVQGEGPGGAGPAWEGEAWHQEGVQAGAIPRCQEKASGQGLEGRQLVVAWVALKEVALGAARLPYEARALGERAGLSCTAAPDTERGAMTHCRCGQRAVRCSCPVR